MEPWKLIVETLRFLLFLEELLPENNENIRYNANMFVIFMAHWAVPDVAFNFA